MSLASLAISRLRCSRPYIVVCSADHPRPHATRRAQAGCRPWQRQQQPKSRPPTNNNNNTRHALRLSSAYKSASACDILASSSGWPLLALRTTPCLAQLAQLAHRVAAPDGCGGAQLVHLSAPLLSAQCLERLRTALSHQSGRTDALSRKDKSFGVLDDHDRGDSLLKELLLWLLKHSTTWASEPKTRFLHFAFGPCFLLPSKVGDF